MKTITTVAVMLLALLTFDAEAALTCEPSPVLAGSHVCTESRDDTSQYIWEIDDAGGRIEQLTSPNMAIYHCPPKETWPPVDVGGIPVQDVQHMTIRVVMPFLMLGMIAEHTTTVECSGQAPEPMCTFACPQTNEDLDAYAVIDEVCAKRENAPASTRKKGVSSLRGFRGFTGRGIGDFGGTGDDRGMDIGPIDGMDLGNDNRIRMRRCRD